MRPIERYVRCSMDIVGPKRRIVGSIEAGLQYNPDDVATALRADLRAGLDHVRSLAGRNENFDRLSRLLEDHVKAKWPGRAWFVEVWNEGECLTQVYQPYGVSQNH